MNRLDETWVKYAWMLYYRYIYKQKGGHTNRQITEHYLKNTDVVIQSV